MKCPECDAHWRLNPQLMDTETITVALTFQGQLIDAETIGKLLVNTAKCVKETARCIGAKKTEVFVMGLNLSNKRFSADLLVACYDGKNEEEVVKVFNETMRALAGEASE